MGHHLSSSQHCVLHQHPILLSTSTIAALYKQLKRRRPPVHTVGTRVTPSPLAGQYCSAGKIVGLDESCAKVSIGQASHVCTYSVAQYELHRCHRPPLLLPGGTPPPAHHRNVRRAIIKRHQSFFYPTSLPPPPPPERIASLH